MGSKNKTVSDDKEMLFLCLVTIDIRYNEM